MTLTPELISEVLEEVAQEFGWWIELPGGDGFRLHMGTCNGPHRAFVAKLYQRLRESLVTQHGAREGCYAVGFHVCPVDP